MICPQCENQALGNYCSDCGFRLNPSVQRPVATRQALAVAGSGSIAQTAVAAPAELTGVGGWLQFYCLWLVIGGSLTLFVRDEGSHSVLAIVMKAVTIVGICAGISLWTVNQWALRLLELKFAGSFVELCAFGIAYFLEVATDKHATLGSGLAVAMFVSLFLIWQFAWIAYFRKSKRVRATYHSKLFAELSAGM